MAGGSPFSTSVSRGADGYQVSNKVVLRAWNPQPVSASSRCPSNLLYYTDIILAFPMSVPPDDAGMQPNTRFKGMPAMHFSSESNPAPPAESMGEASCY